MVERKTDRTQAIMKAISFLVFMIFLLHSCITNNNKTKPIISVSILPQKYFVEKIAGNNFEINVLIPPGASPASYDPSPAQIVELAKSQIYFKIGYIEFEKNWLDKITVQYEQLAIIDNSVGIKLIKNQQFDNDHGHQHGYYEPHTWMSPENVKIIANSIFKTIISIDKQNESFYTDNYNRFISEVDSINLEILNKLQYSTNRSFIIYHPALSYFARNYELQQIPIEIEGKNPSAHHIKEIIDLAKSQQIKIVFIQKQFDQEKAKTIANEIGGSVIPIDPLDYNWSDQILSIANVFIQVPETPKK